MIETREMTPASTDMTRELFSERCKVNTRTNRLEAHRMNKKDTMGRKCHRRNAQEIVCFSQRFSADRETLSRVLQSALIAGQGTHTVQEASHGHSSCAGSEDPVWTWSWWTGLARASERKRAGERTSPRREAHDCEFRGQRAGLFPILRGSSGFLTCVCVTEDCQCSAK